MVTMTLLSFIVLGLLMMFNQTQRAFRAGLGYTDVLEGGRGAIDMVVRELEQVTPSEGSDIVQTSGSTMIYNFWTRHDSSFPNPLVQYVSPPVAPSTMPVLRTNIIQQFFLLTRLNQDWTAVWYRVIPDSPNSIAGSLYRYSTIWPRYAPLDGGDWILRNNALPSPNLWSGNRVADGVVHLQLRVFDTNGVPLVPFNNRMLAATVNPYRPSVTNAYATFHVTSGVQLDELDCAFWNNAVPAYLELELGIMEPKTLQHYRAIDPNTPAALNYLSNHIGQVHIFRQRIPIRNVDFSAYQ
jgi:hypothetical protein